MSKIVIGIDPDSDKHGVAVYIDGKLYVLDNLQLLSVMSIVGDLIYNNDPLMENTTVHIEDVCAMKAVFYQRQKGNKSPVQQSMARRLGMCQQSQVELERVFDSLGVKVVKHKISKTWKKDKAQFEKVTGWKGRSNEDTRSAAYFGYLGLNKSSRNC